MALLTACEADRPGADRDPEEVFAIQGALVFTSPDADPIEDGVVVVLDGVIEAVGERGDVQVPPGARRVSAPGLSLLAGFWNADVFIDDELLSLADDGTDEELSAALEERFTRYGFTTVVDAGSDPVLLQPLRDRIASGQVAGPRIIAASGELPVAVHQAGWWSGMEAERVSLQGMPSGDVAIMPALTLASVRGEAESPEAAAARLSQAIDTVARFAEEGGAVVFGTGAGYVPEHDPAMELILLDEAGLSFPQILDALTRQPAARFGQGYLGLVEQGMVADLVLVEGDPGSDPTAFNRVRWVIRDGRTIYDALR